MPDIHVVAPFSRPPHSTRVTAEGNLPRIVCGEEQSRSPALLILVAVVALVLAYGLVQSWDDAAREREAHRVAQAKAARTEAGLRGEIAAINAMPQIRIDTSSPNGIRCDQFHIRAEWTQAIGERCMQLGQLILTARMKD